MQQVTLKEIKIFLAGSLRELCADRDAVSQLVEELNEIYRRYGYVFRLYRCENAGYHMNPGGRKQDEHNGAVRASDIFFLQCRWKLGKYTREEFEVAHETLLQTGSHPAIFVGFRKTFLGITSFLLSRFKRDIWGKEAHFTRDPYGSQAELKLYFLLHLLRVVPVLP